MRYNYYKNLLNSIDYASAIASKGQRVLLLVDTKVGYELSKLPKEARDLISVMKVGPYLSSNCKPTVMEDIEKSHKSRPFCAIATNQNLPLMHILTKKLRVMAVQVSQGTRQTDRKTTEVSGICNEKFKIFNDRIEDFLSARVDQDEFRRTLPWASDIEVAVSYACEAFIEPGHVHMNFSSCLIGERLNTVYSLLIKKLFLHSTLWKNVVKPSLVTDYLRPTNGDHLINNFFEIGSTPKEDSLKNLSQKEALVAMDLIKEIVGSELHNFEQLCPESFSVWATNFIDGFNYFEEKEGLDYEPNASEKFLKEEGFL